jgi:hypothetical protein
MDDDQGILTDAKYTAKLQEVREALDCRPICSQEGMRTVFRTFFGKDPHDFQVDCVQSLVGDSSSKPRRPFSEEVQHRPRTVQAFAHPSFLCTTNIGEICSATVLADFHRWNVRQSVAYQSGGGWKRFWLDGSVSKGNRWALEVQSWDSAGAGGRDK